MTDHSTARALVARLRAKAQAASDISRRMAEDKSLRQDGNTERRTDLYMWQTPEQTVEWQAADFIEQTLTPPEGDTLSDEVARDISGETVCGFRVAAWRETHPEHGDKYGHQYSEHWSTPSTRDPRVKVERLFTEDQLRAALQSRVSPQEGLRERRVGYARCQSRPLRFPYE